MRCRHMLCCRYLSCLSWRNNSMCIYRINKRARTILFSLFAGSMFFLSIVFLILVLLIRIHSLCVSAVFIFVLRRTKKRSFFFSIHAFTFKNILRICTICINNYNNNNNVPPPIERSRFYNRHIAKLIKFYTANGNTTAHDDYKQNKSKLHTKCCVVPFVLLFIPLLLDSFNLN